MLTVEENYWNFKFLKLCIFLGLFPLQLDSTTSRISAAGKRQMRMWFLRFGIGILQTIYLMARLVQSVLDLRYFYVNHFVIHYLFVSGYSMMLTWMYFCFILYLPDFIIIFNQLFVQVSKRNIADIDFGVSLMLPMPMPIEVDVDGRRDGAAINSAHSEKGGDPGKYFLIKALYS